ncbi:MAG: hypothetical protein MUE61_08535 [Vicinamibacterales bacterium]|jgi:hypothetical protein|nr:hypothetical protein [Vicinamibacterales bacterium]MCU0562356.1 hypothetical protein [Desulfobacterales bacterium]
MEPDEWATWQRHETDRPCEECPVSFAIAMRAEHRCNGIPRAGLPRPNGRRPLITAEEAQARERRRWRESKRRSRAAV